jgi:hypothetical protein
LGALWTDLLAVDDLQCSLWRPSADVSSVQPSILVQCLFGQLWHFVVALEDIRSFDAHFSGTITRQVVELRNIDKFDCVAGGRHADMTGDWVALDCDL